MAKQPTTKVDAIDRIRAIESKIAEILAKQEIQEGVVKSAEEKLRSLGVDPPTVDEAKKRLSELEVEMVDIQRRIQELLDEASSLIGDKNDD